MQDFCVCQQNEIDVIINDLYVYNRYKDAIYVCSMHLSRKDNS